MVVVVCLCVCVCLEKFTPLESGKLIDSDGIPFLLEA